MISGLKLARSFKRLPACATTLVVLCLACSTAAATPEVKIKGNRTLSSRVIKTLLGELRWHGDRDETAIRNIQEAYIRRGRLFATIRLQRNPADSTIVMTIDEGEAARLGRVNILGASRYDAATIRRVLAIQEGRLFEPDALNRGVKELLEMYDHTGFPFAQVWMDSLVLQPETSRVGLTVHIVEGEPKTLSRVGIEGLQKTREEVAIKLSGLRAGEPYDGREVREAYLRLSSSGVFDDVAYPTIQISPQGRGVEALINVREPKRSHSFSGALGYAEREGVRDRVLSGVVQLDLINMGGTLRDLNVFWRSDGAGRIQTELVFRQRFFLGRRMSVGLSLQQVGQDTVYTWQSLGVETAAPVGRLWGGLLGVDFATYGDRNTFADGPVAKSLRLRLVGGYSLVWGKLHRGTYVAVNNRYALASKRADGRDGTGRQSAAQHIVEAEIRTAFELPQHVHFVNQSVFKNLSSKEEQIPLSEQFYVGGAATVRGYRENQFHSRRLAYSRTELMLGRSRAENGYVFVDAGYYLREQQLAGGELTAEDRFVFGHGFGLRTRSRAGDIDISFAVGEEFSLRQTKLHVILNRKF